MTWSHLLFALIGWLVIESLIWIARAAMKEGVPSPEMHEHVDAEGRPHG